MNTERPLALPLGELAAKPTERVLGSPKGRAKGVAAASVGNLHCKTRLLPIY